MDNLIGKILHELLSKKGAPTKKDFAGILGISTKTLYNVIDGSSQLTIEQISKASEVLKFDIISEYDKKFSNKSVITNARFVSSSAENIKTPVLTYSFGIPVESYGNIKSFQDEINKIAEKHGMIILD